MRGMVGMGVLSQSPSWGVQRANAAASSSATAPTAPRNLTDVGANGLDEDISWLAPLSNGGSAITGYNIYLDEDGAGFVLWTTAAAGATTKTLTTLSSAVPYQCYIKAVNAIGESVASNTISFTSP